MATPPLSDATLLETLAVLERHNGSTTKASQELGASESTLRRHRNEAIARGLHLSGGAREAMQASGLNGAEIAGGWRHVLDDEGRKIETVRWSVPKQELALETVMERIEAAFKDIPAAPPVSAPEAVLDDLCTVYPVADAHIGMRAWKREVGEEYDTDIATKRLRDWIGRLVASSPASKEAVILDVGDTTHATDDTNQTPRSKHVLDVDTRHFRTLEASIEALACAVELTLSKHEKVTVVILPGNHSTTSYMAILFALAERYRENPRVTVHKEPGEFWVHQFGRNMLASHHGDKAKPERIAMFLADEFSEIWGATRHRWLWTGHLHSHRSADIGGLRWEQLRAMTARDSYAFSNAYSARSQLQAITLHRDDGEVQRCSVGI